MVRLPVVVIASAMFASLVCHCSSDRGFAGDNPSTGFGDGGGADASADSAACAAITLGTDHRPLDLYIMMDVSGSMFGVPWRQAKDALSDFFENPGATSVAAAINYFPSPAPNDCDEEYYKLFPVDLGPLPSHAAALETSLATITPKGGTPLAAAVDGALFTAIAQKRAHPDHAVAALVVTDGAPNDCGVDLGPTLSIVRAALVEKGVPTFTIGIGNDATLVLDPIAMAGGSGHSLTVADPSGLAEKIREAQSVAVGCEFIIPASSPDGKAVDPSFVNVTFASGMRPSHVVREVGSASACGTAEGWYYDDPKNPKTVRLCAGSCALLNTSVQPKVDVNFGCATEIR